MVHGLDSAEGCQSFTDTAKLSRPLNPVDLSAKIREFLLASQVMCSIQPDA